MATAIPLDFNTPVSGQSANFNTYQPTSIPQIASNVYNGISNFVGAQSPTKTVAGAQTGPQYGPAPINTNTPPTNNPAPAPVNQRTNGSIAAQYYASGGKGDVPVGYNGNQGSAPSQDDINNQINDIYNSSNQYLDQAESQVRSDFPTVQQDIQGQYNTNQGQLDVTHNANTQQFGNQSDQAGYANQNALADSRRLYSDLRSGYQSRFGGATSAGDAANEIANVEQQRQEGQQNRSYQQAQTTINTQKNQVDAQYQQSAQALKTQTDAALNQATRDFQNKLLTISQSRAQNEQAKGQAKLQALQDLRNQVFSINQQNTQFQQTLQAQANQAALQLQNYQALAGQGASTASAALNPYLSSSSVAPQSNLQVGGTQAPQSTQVAGAITPGQPNYQRYPNDGFSY